MPRQSLIDYLQEYPKHGRSTAFVRRSGYRTSRSSYRDVAGLAAQCAREFERVGIAPGDRVLLWGRNSAEWVAAFFGCILRGAVAVPMDQGATADFAGRVARQVDARLVLADRENLLIGEQRPAILFDSLREAVGKHSSEPYVSPPLDRSSIAQIIFTSGATAEPKGVVISHGNILANLEPLEAGDAAVPEVGTLRSPAAISRSCSREPRLRAIHGRVGPAAARWLRLLSGFAQPVGNYFDDPEASACRFWLRCRACSKRCRARSSAISRRKGRLETFRKDFAAAENEKVLAPHVALPGNSSAVRLEILGRHFRRRDAGPGNGAILGPHRIRRNSGLRADGNDFAGQRESPVSHRARLDWESATRPRSETG